MYRKIYSQVALVYLIVGEFSDTRHHLIACVVEVEIDLKIQGVKLSDILIAAIRCYGT
jgi:hypothetical protein